MFVDVVFPLPFRNSFTYSVSEDLQPIVQTGVRVVVPFGKRILTGFVISIKDKADTEDKIKPVMDVLDEYAIFDETSLKFYKWIADYYLSSLGEAIKNSIPYGSDVESKRMIACNSQICSEVLENEKNKKSTRSLVLSALTGKELCSVGYLQKASGKKNIHSVLRTLAKQGIISIHNEIENAKVRTKKVKHVRIIIEREKVYDLIPELESRSPKQVVILLDLLQLKGESKALAELLKKTGTNQSSVSSLAEKGVVEVFDKEVERIYSETYEETGQNFTLTETQSQIINSVGKDIDEGIFKTYLLHGVTGSGKTQVYIELAKKALSQNKTVMILVPEISLTPQMTARLFNNFGDLVSVIHSRMSLGERYDSWRRILSGKSKIAVGARSALFAPLKNIGLIVVDEEHDSSYKQNEIIPKYHARDSAVVKASIYNCPVILGSATPSVESMHNAETGKYTLLELPERVDNAKLPHIRLINVSAEEKKKTMDNAFSNILLDKIAQRLKAREGVIILQNRRGFATQVYCEDCGEIITCSDCSVSMVHHINKNILKCHYCNKTITVPKACVVCGSLALKFFGTGTQRVEDELAYHFPQAKIERIDSDSISEKGKLGIILNDFRKGEIDILIGTQIVSKGLDFANVTLVGVISAETTLWMPDFRADERTFQLLTQVAGRAGRSSAPGEVLIQTKDDKHFVLQKVLLNDYKGFYEKEISLRKKTGYPPFVRLCLIETKDEKESAARDALKDFYKILLKYNSKLQVMPPAEAVILRVKGQYRFQLLIKSSRITDAGGAVLRKAVLETYIEFNKVSRFRNVRLTIDVDPQNII